MVQTMEKGRIEAEVVKYINPIYIIPFQIAMQSQLSLAEYSKRQAIATVEAGSPTFCALAYETLLLVAKRKREFTSLEVWAAYDGPKPKSPKAMGPVFTRARNAGVIVATNRFVKSGRVSDHNQFIRIWESRIYV